MKKQYFYAMALMATLSLGSCSNSSDLDSEFGNGTESVEQDGQVLKLCVENGGNGIVSRAGRPLYSSAAMQDINQIDLYVVSDDKKVVLKKTISAAEWENATDYSNGGHGKELTISFKKSLSQNLDQDKKYTIYAIGYKTGNKYTNVGIFDASTTTVTTTDSKALDFDWSKMASINNGEKAEEIFAGQVSVYVGKRNNKSVLLTAEDKDEDRKLNPALVLNRQVAGVIGYFSNIPAKVGERVPAKIRLVASNKSNKLFFSSLASGETDGDVTTAVTNVVNGEQNLPIISDANFFDTSKLAYLVYEIDLKEFFPELKAGTKTFDKLDLDGDGYVGYKDAQYYVYGNAEGFNKSTWAEDQKGENGKKALSGFWKNPNEGKQQLVAGSVFAGDFLIPFAQTENNTFEIQLIDKDGNILKTWNVQVNKAVAGTYAQGMSKSGTIPAGDALKYNIYRNQLYTMGLKAHNIDPTNPTPKPEPDPDPTPGKPDPEDKPAELTNGQDLLLHVNDNWEIIHDMIID